MSQNNAHILQVRGLPRRIIMRETAGLSPYGLAQRNNSTAGINCVRPPTIPPSSSLKLEATSLAKQRRLFRQI